MREYKFRGKLLEDYFQDYNDHKNKGEFIYGYGVMLDDDKSYIPLFHNTYDKSSPVWIPIGEAVNFHLVDKNTIGQFTGLLDKNGKEIYEGDILNSLYRDDGCQGRYVIEWYAEDGRFICKRIGNHQQTMVSISLSDMRRCEVIGNIHER